MALKTIVPFEHGLSWVMDEWMQRASHALLVDGKVWLIDPVDVPEPLAQAEQLGPIAGVIQLLDRHPRGCKALAERYGVPLHRLPDGPIDGLSMEVFSVVRSKHWQERALWSPQTRTLVVAELLGTNDYYAPTGELGVHAFLRATKTKIDETLPVRHLLVGHGEPIHGDDIPAQIKRAYSRRVKDLWRVPLGFGRALAGSR